MPENEANVKGIYLPFWCLDAISHLDDEDAVAAIRAYVSFAKGEPYELIINQLNQQASCAFEMLLNYAGTFGEE